MPEEFVIHPFLNIYPFLNSSTCLKSRPISLSLFSISSASVNSVNELEVDSTPTALPEAYTLTPIKNVAANTVNILFFILITFPLSLSPSDTDLFTVSMNCSDIFGYNSFSSFLFIKNPPPKSSAVFFVLWTICFLLFLH